MPAVLAVVISVLAGLISGLTLPSTASGANPTTRSGVYCSTSDPACVNAFAAWRGKPVDAVLTFLSSSNWAGIEAPDSWLVPWTTNPYKDDVVITVPLLPSTGDAADSTPTMAEGAAGDYDSHFVTLATRLVGAGLGSSVIRLGHEFNGTWYAWSAKPSPSNFVAYWQHAVTAMRSVPGANFTFDWNVNNAMVVWDARTAYPGDAYVDTIGEDVYDFHWGSTGQTPQQRWAYIVEPGGTYSEGLRWWADFAASRGKPLSYAEWALTGKGASMANGGEGVDDPYFIQQMSAWIASHNVAFAIYFNRNPNDGDHAVDTGEFPQAAAAYVQAFGDPGVALGPSPLPSGWTPPSPSPTDTASATDTGSATDTASPTGSVSPSETATPSPDGTATVTPTPTPKPTITPSPSPSTALSLLVSTSNARTSAVTLNGRTVKGSIYVFATGTGVKSVKFYIDDTTRAKAPTQTENTAPFDLAGTMNGKANPYATTKLSTGKHTLTIAAVMGSTTRVMTATFTVTR